MGIRCLSPECTHHVPKEVVICNGHIVDYEMFCEAAERNLWLAGVAYDEEMLRYLYSHQPFMDPKCRLVEDSQLLMKFKDTDLGKKREELYQHHMHCLRKNKNKKQATPLELETLLGRSIDTEERTFTFTQVKKILMFDACWIAVDEIRERFAFLHDEESFKSFLEFAAKGFFGCRPQPNPLGGAPMLRAIQVVDLQERFLRYVSEEHVKIGQRIKPREKIKDPAFEIKALASLIGVTHITLRVWLSEANCRVVANLVAQDQFVAFMRQSIETGTIPDTRTLSQRALDSMRNLLSSWDQNNCLPTAG